MARRNGPGGGRGPLWLWFLVAAIALGLLFYWLDTRFPGAISGADDARGAWAVHHLVLIAVLGAALIVRIRARPGTALKHGAIWMLVGVGLILAYSFRDDIYAVRDRVVAELIPQSGRTTEAGNVVFKRDRGGHFAVDALVDGSPVRFLVDTGASEVVLSPADAERIGFDLDALTYNRTYRTANGIGAGAPIRLGVVKVGPIELGDVRASVNQAPMSGSLLGLTFLDRLTGYRVEGDTLTLIP